MKTNEVKTVVAILIPDKTDFKTKAVTTDKEEPCNSTSGYLSEETQNTKSKGHIHTCIHCSVIYNSQYICLFVYQINR